MNNALSETPEIHRTATAIPDDSYPLPLERFYHFEKNHSQKPFLIQPRKGEVQTWTWHEVGQEVRRFAAYLKSLNLPVGSHIALLSTNCAHWIMSDLAIWMAGHVTVPLCPTLTEHSVNQILVHSDAALLMVGKLDDWPTMKAGVLKGMPRVALLQENGAGSGFDGALVGLRRKKLCTDEHQMSTDIIESYPRR
jgi:long-subunit acyl-CoA synthetase (AMP-forming)